MYKKLNIKTLGIVLGLLLIAVVAVYISDSSRGERSFRAEMVDADTSNITSVVIYPRADKDNAIELKKESGRWKLVTGSKVFRADEGAVKNILTQLADMKPQRLVATEKSKWGDFDVTDSLATRVKLYTGKKLVTHLYVGRFNYQPPKNQNQYNYGQQGTFSTFVRLEDEKDVYSVEGFIGMSLDRRPDDFRDKTLVRFDQQGLSRLTFTYPADSSFSIFKEGNNWTINGLECDSAQVAQYLGSLSYLNGSSFAEYDLVAGKQPVYTLKVDGNNFSAPVEVKAYLGDNPGELLLTSSLNDGSCFKDDIATLANRIFISRQKLLKGPSFQAN
ncbi:MAG: DUF4340 domain-containing protein [Bacteroidales bacterium]|nr:DUF4340 domain-containing protein [Bacteroidales bacterium]